MNTEVYEKLRLELDPINREIGIIVQFSQQMELGIRYAISLVKSLNRENDDDVFESEYDAMAKSTLGYLIKNIKKSIPLESHDISLLDETLKRRNYIVHEIFTDRMEELATPKGRDKALKYLKESRAVIYGGIVSFKAIVSKFMEASGLNPNEISRNTFNAIDV